jgi:tetratricopeptide (TPR) repeat protein
MNAATLWRSAAFATLLLSHLGPYEAAAQPSRTPPRPTLDAGADTNSAQEYYQFGVQQLARRPQVAADAFYWASRLAPPWADPYYARATALVLGDRSRLVRYFAGDESVMMSREVAFSDSLYYAAFARNPLVVTRLDRHLYDELISQLTRGEVATMSRVRSGDIVWDARKASLQGRYAEALRHWAIAIKRNPDSIVFHVHRSKAFNALEQNDSAVTEMTRAVEKLRARDGSRISRLFESIAMYEHAVAFLHVQRGDDKLAREAYERALLSDLSFYHARAGLADVALRQGDTASAVSEYGQAVALSPDDGGLRAGYAMALVQANRHGEAVTELQRAIELEPWFAQPYYVLGRLFDHAGFTDQAVAQYDAFLARAPRGLDEGQWVEARRKELRTPAP